MNKWLRISKLPTSISRKRLESILLSGAVGIHESVLRSHAIVEEVEYLLIQNTPPEILLGIIAVMKSGESDAR
jgi:hypothetical protein